MKIIQFTDSFLPIADGVGNVVLQYVTNMAEKGHEVYVVAPQGDTGFRGRFPFEIIDYVGVQLSKMKSYKAGIPGLDPNCLRRLNMIDADIIHVHSPFTAGQAGIQYGKSHNIPIVGTFHSNYYDDIMQVTGTQLIAAAGSKYVGGIYNKCDEVWAVSRQSKKAIESYGCTRPIRIMVNGTDIVLPEEAFVQKVDQKYGLTGHTVFLYVGQINWKKNIRCILDACALLDQDFRLVLAGEGPHEAEIQKLCVKNGLEDRVIFTGYISDLKEKTALYKRSDLFLFPSLYDTAGLVVREAAAAETPSVTVRGSGASECIRDGTNGFLCKDDPRSLANVITRVMKDRRKLEVIGREAKETIPIPWSELTDQVLLRYQELIRNYDRSGQNRQSLKTARNSEKEARKAEKRKKTAEKKLKKAKAKKETKKAGSKQNEL